MWGSKRHIFYCPFSQSSIQFSNETLVSKETFYLETISDVDLYYQPLQYPILAIFYLILEIIIIIVGEFVHIQILELLKFETCLIKDILKTFLYLQMVFWPVAVVFDTSTDFIHPLKEIVGPWYCEIGFAWTLYGLAFVSFHSFITGLMRYIFVVHFDKVRKYGKQKTKKIFLWISILIPLLLTLWGYFGRKEISSISSINKCNGKHHYSFLAENSFDSAAKRSFCSFEKYDEDDNEFLVIIKKSLCTLHAVLLIVMGSNCVEAILYWKTIKHSNQ
jgi:hypothetical protein